MRRLSLLAACVSAVVVLVPATAAHAATVVSSELPPELLFSAGGCSGGAGSGGTYTHVAGPSTPSAPPLGAGSLQIMQPVDTSSSIEYDWQNAPPPSDLTGLSIGSYRPVGGARAMITAWVITSAPGVEPVEFDQVQASLPNSAAWNTTNFLAVPLHAWHYDGSNFSDLGYFSTWSAYAGSRGADTLAAVSLDVETCDQSTAGSIYVDGFSITSSEITAQWDFEQGPVPGLTISAGSTAVSGAAVNVSTTMTHVGSSAQQVSLWAKPAGASAYKQVAATQTDSSGVASSTQHPTVTTTYQWRYAGDPDNAPANSPTKTVKVATRLTMHVYDATLTTTQPLIVWGAESPVKSGATVSVWRAVSGPDVKVATATVQSDGTWSFHKALAKGRYVLYATVPATSTNTAGRSATVTVTVT